jgi:SSS family solute:Na+ symporter/sodium/proline symporter
MSIYFLTVVVYLAIMIFISFSRALFIRDQQDFMVGGRKVSTFLMITTLIATWTGAGSLIGGAGLAYRQGFSELWMSVGAWIAILIVYKLAGRVRHIAEYTLPDILEDRYNSAARFFGSLALIIGCTTIVGYQLKGGALVLEIIAGIPWEKGVEIMAVGIILLTALAGMKSIVSLDLLNGILILIAILIAVPLLYFDIGGYEAVKTALPAGHLSLFGGRNIIWAAAVFFPVFFLLLGEPTMYQKFFSTKNEVSAKHAVIGWVIGIIIVDVAICTLAVLGRIKFPHLGEAGQAERVILDVARYGLPAWAGCILLAGAMAIVFSTANSFLLTPATNITHDIIQRFLAKKAGQNTIIVINRATIIVLGVTAYLLLTKFRNVLTMALTAYTMIGAGLTPAILAAFFWKRVTTAGGLASIIGGIAGTIAAKIIFDIQAVQLFFTEKFAIPGDELGEYIIIPAFLLAVLLLVFVSLTGKKPPEEKWQKFFEIPKG